MPSIQTVSSSKEGDLVEQCSLRRSILANGMKPYRLDLDPVGSAFLDDTIRAHVGQAIHAPRFDEPDFDGHDSGAPDAGGPDRDSVLDSRLLTQIAADAVIRVRHAHSQFLKWQGFQDFRTT